MLCTQNMTRSAAVTLEPPRSGADRPGAWVAVTPFWETVVTLKDGP